MSGKELVRFLQQLGYELVSVHGSHHKFRRGAGDVIIVPLHGSKPLAIGTLHHIVTKKLKMTPEEFAEKMRNT